MAIMRKMFTMFLFVGFYFICDIIVITSLYPLKVSGLDYRIGKTYSHQYLTNVVIDGNSGFELSAHVEISVIWQDPQNPSNKLIKLQINEPFLSLQPSGINEKKVNISSQIAQLPSYFLWSAGKVNNFFTSTKDTTIGIDLKKGIASLFIINQKSEAVTEVDASGSCSVNYLVDANSIQRTKHSCKPYTNDHTFSHPKKILDVTTESLIVVKVHLSQDRNIIHQVISKETNSISLNIRKKLKANVTGVQILNFEKETSGDTFSGGSLEAVIKSIGGHYKQNSLNVEAKSKICSECKSIKELIVDYREQLKVENLATLDSSESYIQLLPHFQQASQEDLIYIVKDKQNKDILPQIFDLLAASQTSASENVALDYLDLTDENQVTLIERYLFAVSFVTHPTENFIKKLLAIIQKKISDDRVRQSLELALGAIVHTYNQIKQNCDNELALQFKEIIVKKLKACTEEPCQLEYIRVLANARLPSTLEILQEYIAKNDRLAIESIQALQRMPKNSITDKIKKILEKIYYQVEHPFNSTARIAAAETLLVNEPDIKFIQDIILSQRDNATYETAKYLLSRIRELSETDQNFRKLVLEAYEKCLSAKNYLYLAKEGFSSAFSNKLADISDILATYSLRMENIKTGMLKKSSLDVNLALDEDEMNLLSFSIYTEGLEGFGSDSEDESESDTPATSGLSFRVMDVLVRPVVLFNGMGEVMSLVWRGVGTEPISALQGILLLHNHHQLIALQNGFILQYNVYGTLSIDVSGSMQVSLWYRNAQSAVTNRGAFLIHGNVQVHSPLVQSEVQFGCDSESFIDFETIIDFYQTPFKACLLMTHPELKIRHHKKKYTHILNSNLSRKKVWSKIMRIPAKTFDLGHENSKRCTIMTLDS